MESNTICLLVLAILGAGCATQPGNTQSDVRALQYRIRVFDGGMDVVHGGGKVVNELFLPDHGVACNIEWSMTPELELVPWRLRAFRATNERMSDALDISEIVLPAGMATSIVELASQQHALARQVQSVGLLVREPGHDGSTAQLDAAPDGASRRR